MMIICFMSTPSPFPRKHLFFPENICFVFGDVFLKTSPKTKNYYAEDVLKTFLEDLLKILRRQTKYLLGISVYLSRDNKSKCVSNKSVFHKSISDNSKANPECINYWWLVWCYEISLIQIRHCRKGEAIKTNF